MKQQVGLTDSEVKTARETAGWNELPQVARIGPLRVFLRQFTSFLVLILIVAAGLALALGETIDALTIGLVVGLNAALGFAQEWKAETALSSLRKMLSPQALVLRDGREHLIPARNVVPGDILVLTAGAKIVADATVLDANELYVDESVLTGESLPVSKGETESTNAVFAGTAITQGRARAQVTKTGANTEFGKIAQMTGSVGTKVTNLQNKLGQLAKQLGFAALVVAGSITLLGLWLGRDLTEMVMMGLSLSVAMVPEGLPAVVTITLALGATAMVRRQALVRRLQAVETLGAASVICTDKTGTLTENKMTVTKIWTRDQTFDVSGTGYDPIGSITVDGAPIATSEHPVLSDLLHVALDCSHAQVDCIDGAWTLTGAPTEGALVTLALKGGLTADGRANPIAEIPFSSARKRMSILVPSDQGADILTKGAPEQIMEVCTRFMTADGPIPRSDAHRHDIQAAYEHFAQQGLRVIALARRPAPNMDLEETDLIFLGLVGLIDPPRSEVRDAIVKARAAGIRVVMITGDSPITAGAIAAQLSLHISEHLTGADLDALDDAQLAQRLKGDVLFARTKPAQKMRIVSALQAQGQIVAMTGDGVNDAPALKQADIGVAMGIRGTDVARDASDLVLLDDNFSTIVGAIAEGRRQFANLQKFVRYLLSSNAGEVVALTINIAIGGPLVFLATQILWMNLVTDGVTAVALGLEKSEPDEMARPPRAKKTPILGLSGIVTICVLGTYTGLSSLWIFFHIMDLGVDLARTTAFTAMVVFEKVSVFAFRSLRLPSTQIGWLSNRFLLGALAVTLGAQVLAVYWPPLQVMLHTVPLGVDEWTLIGLFALPILVLPELFKVGRAQIQRAI